MAAAITALRPAAPRQAPDPRRRRDPHRRRGSRHLSAIMIRTARGDQVYWFAGFRPSHGVAIGIDFEVQPLSAGLACLAAVLVTGAMIFFLAYFELDRAASTTSSC